VTAAGEGGRRLQGSRRAEEAERRSRCPLAGRGKRGPHTLKAPPVDENDARLIVGFFALRLDEETVPHRSELASVPSTKSMRPSTRCSLKKCHAVLSVPDGVY
jgi:hypothetical protein